MDKDNITKTPGSSPKPVKKETIPSSKLKGQTGSVHDKSGVKRQRVRLPVRATLSLNESLLANERHPLAHTPPETRDATRCKLIAAVLARIAKVATG